MLFVGYRVCWEIPIAALLLDRLKSTDSHTLSEPLWYTQEGSRGLSFHFECRHQAISTFLVQVACSTGFIDGYWRMMLLLATWKDGHMANFDLVSAAISAYVCCLFALWYVSYSFDANRPWFLRLVVTFNCTTIKHCPKMWFERLSGSQQSTFMLSSSKSSCLVRWAPLRGIFLPTWAVSFSLVIVMIVSKGIGHVGHQQQCDAVQQWVIHALVCFSLSRLVSIVDKY